MSPCKCDGTMKYVHLNCVKTWLQQQLHVKSNQCWFSYQCKIFECELCKSSYPAQIQVGEKKFDTLELPKPDSPYFIMEMLSRDRNVCKSYYAVTLSKKNQIKFGRGHDADIRITDISVSRIHAVIKFEKGNFYVEDQDSKFGTLALMQMPMNLGNDSTNFAVQIGRTVLHFFIKKEWKIKTLCRGSKKQ